MDGDLKRAANIIFMPYVRCCHRHSPQGNVLITWIAIFDAGAGHVLWSALLGRFRQPPQRLHEAREEQAK